MREHDRVRVLLAARKSKVDELAQLLIADPNKSTLIEQVSAQIDQIDRAIRELSSGWRPRTRVMAIAIASAVIISIAAECPLNSVAFTLNVTAHEMSIQAATNGWVEDLNLKTPVRVVGFDEVESGLLENTTIQPTYHAAVIVASHLRLTSASVPAGSILDLESRPGAFSLSVQGTMGGFNDETEIDGSNAALRSEPADESGLPFIGGNFTTAETVIFRAVPALAAAPSPAPKMLAIYSEHLDGRSVIRGVVPRSLRFTERRRTGPMQNPFESSVVKGTIQIVATGETYPLGPDDSIELTELATNRFDVNVTDQIEVRASGTARGLHLRTGGFERRITPSVLEYLSSNHKLGLLWTGALFIWGLLWSIRKVLRGESP